MVSLAIKLRSRGSINLRERLDNPKQPSNQARHRSSIIDLHHWRHLSLQIFFKQMRGLHLALLSIASIMEKFSLRGVSEAPPPFDSPSLSFLPLAALPCLIKEPQTPLPLSLLSGLHLLLRASPSNCVSQGSITLAISLSLRLMPLCESAYSKFIIFVAVV